jgi:uncharacterized protein (DUF1697 family)
MKYIALLRGINVGGKHSVSMSSLSTVFQNLGYSHVRTYINSGNAIFNSESENFSIIEPTLEKFYGFEIPVLTLSTKQLQNICQAIQPDWHNNTDQKTDVLFLFPDYDDESSCNHIPARSGIDTITYVPGAIIWHIEKKNYAKSAMKDFARSLLYKNVTVRNCNTVRKLQALLKEEE